MNQLSKNLSILFLFLYWIDWRVEVVLLSFLIFSIVLSKVEFHRKIVFNFSDLIFVFYVFFVVVTNQNDADFWKILRDMVISIWAIKWCYQNLEYTERYQSQLIFSLSIICLVLSLFMFFQESPGHFNFSVQYIITKDRNIGFYFIYKDLVGPTTIAAIFSVGITYLLLSVVKKINIIKIVLIILTLLLITISGGRSSWIAIFCIILTIIYLKTDLLNAKNWIMLSIILVTIILLFILLSPYIPIFYSYEYQRRLIAFTEPLESHTVTVRFIYWGLAMAMYNSNPAGVGFWTFFNMYDRTTHNEILGQLLGVGVVGLFVYLFFYFYSFYELRKMRKYQMTTDDFQIFAYCFFIIIFFTGLTENYSLSSRYLFYPLVWIMFGAISSKLRFLKKV